METIFSLSKSKTLNLLQTNLKEVKRKISIPNQSTVQENFLQKKKALILSQIEEWNNTKSNNTSLVELHYGLLDEILSDHVLSEKSLKSIGPFLEFEIETPKSTYTLELDKITHCVSIFPKKEHSKSRKLQ